MKESRSLGFLAAVCCAAATYAGPVDDLAAAADLSVIVLGATGTVSGFANQTVELGVGEWTAVTKAPGTLSGTASLATFAPDLGLNDTVIFAGAALTGDRVQWTISAPTIIGDVVQVPTDNGLVPVTITAFGGKLTAKATSTVYVQDPVTGVSRNVLLTKSAADSNFLEVKGRAFGLFPITVLFDQTQYEGVGGASPFRPIRGTILLQDFVGDPASKTVVVQIREPGSVTFIETETVPLAADGSFFMLTSKNGVFDVSLKVSHWLRKTTGNVTIGATGVTVDASLINGDVDDDNAVTVFDYGLLSDSFDTVPGDAMWNAEADLDGDFAVTVFDYGILSDRFDLSGDL